MVYKRLISYKPRPPAPRPRFFRKMQRFGPLFALTSRAFINMKALSSRSMVTAIMTNTWAVRLKLLNACHLHLLHRNGENFDSTRYKRSIRSTSQKTQKELRRWTIIVRDLRLDVVDRGG